MRNILYFFIDLLAVYRLTKLIMDDRITMEFRDWYWSKFPANTKMGFLLTCPWCISIWSALVVFSARKLFPNTSDILSKVLAGSAVTGLAYQKGL